MTLIGANETPRIDDAGRSPDTKHNRSLKSLFCVRPATSAPSENEIRDRSQSSGH
jgi:hypothetical protein